MSINFCFADSTSSIPTPTSGTTYVIEKIPGQLSTKSLYSTVKKFSLDIENKMLPEALVWDDLLFCTASRGRLIPFRVEWPEKDSLLYPHVNHAGRCAIRGDILHKFLEEGYLSKRDDTSGALAVLSKSPTAKIIQLDQVLRFVGLQSTSIYKPLSYPTPSKKAQSITIIINYRDRPELMEVCLKSIAGQAVTANIEIVLVDNQSQPANRQAVEEQVKRFLPQEILVCHLNYDAPFNHSAQTNMAAEASVGEVLFMLNNDARFIDKNALQTLADWAMTPGVASVGLRTIGKKGRLVSSGVQTCLPIGTRPVRIQESTVNPLSQTIHYAAGNGFACAAISREIWCELGGLNAIEFPTQYNDADYCLRALDAGFRHIYVGSLHVYHEPGQSETRTRAAVEEIHDKLRSFHPNLGRFHRISPNLTKVTSDVLAMSLNVPALLKICLAYRRLYKKLGLT
ncbi:glycosyltransferase family 2 protein [Nostoc edaphicum CCNP1411]|uniref:Glycosyltransferase family 2 protein n=1 Tax=Nostoc edaphicum CCNP1411 TaxID=1472755 RepID=A0A7D7LDB9_9NOSO|nr:glycosyltransferase [Nostoc edaphicum]QMS90673.1 glycosyltransferase family 2 protein [Nostoc edaphicum CCNP1411]